MAGGPRRDGAPCPHPQAPAEGTQPDEKHAAPKQAAAKKHEEPAKAEPAPKAGAKAASAEDADLESREYTDAEGNVHHHTKKCVEGHKG